MAEVRPGEKSAAVFRAFAMPNRKPRGEWTVPAIEVGTRSTCALNLNDPVVAERHCVFRASEGGFTVEDSGSATGTWHNGLAVRGAVKLASGDQVVVGVTRLTLEVKTDQDPPTCEILVEESSFHYKRPKPGEFHTDADEWVRSEVRFGRIPAVRAMAWLAGLVAIVVASLALGVPRGKEFLQPGALDGTHGALFAADPAARIGSEGAQQPLFLASRAKIADQGCRVCHSAAQPGSVANCVGCHTTFARQHPFLTGDASLDASLDPTVAQPEDSCRSCHEVAHGGRTVAESLAAAGSRVKQGVLGAPGSDVCKQCHSAPLGGKQDVLARIDVLAGLRADKAASSRTERHEYGFDEFSHRKHCGEAAIDCRTCHVPLAGSQGASGGEFQAVTFERCAACHVDGFDAPKELPGYDARALVALRETLGKKHLRVEVGWHGRGPECAQCHERGEADEVVKAALATVERPADEHAFAIVRRTHAQHAQATLDTKADCTGCHADLRTLAGGKSLSAPFRHGSHVETLWPASPEARKALSERSCVTCHANQWKSNSVAAGAMVELASACRQCHSDPSRPDPKQDVTARVVRPATKRTTEFSHELHAGKPGDALAGGCFACHAFDGDGDGDPFAQPTLLKGVENCTKCHTDHQNIEQGACTFCHPSGAAAGSGSNQLFVREKPSRLDWPAGSPFAHFSGSATEGHLSFMGTAGGPTAAQCALCHDGADLKQADKVGDLDIPGARGSLQICIDCHVTKRGWFHWKLPDPPPK
ncbi:MAG TPA: FHA domain-containing protein [Planctomycetota bacterium]|nr:FHA domain-containing protein [Planctomycetota bacterium]